MPHPPKFKSFLNLLDQINPFSSLTLQKTLLDEYVAFGSELISPPPRAAASLFEKILCL